MLVLSRRAHLLLTTALALVALLSTTVAADPLQDGDQLLAKGDLNGALEKYHAACEADPNNYMPFYKRSIVLFGMGKLKRGVRDLDTVLKLKPQMMQAREKRAEMLVKIGRFDDAMADYKELGNSEKEKEILMLKNFLAQADRQAGAGDHANAANIYSKVIESAGNDGDLRMKRASSYIQLGKRGDAISDLRRATMLKAAFTDGFFLLAKLLFSSGDYADALVQIRECVKLDDEHKECFDFYRMLKKFNKFALKVKDNMEKKRYAEALMNLEKVVKMDVGEEEYNKWIENVRCEANSKLGRKDLAKQTCDAAIALDEGNAWNFVYRAKVHELEEDFEDMVADYQKAVDLEKENREFRDGLQRAQRLLKTSQKRNYYKILGVERNADKKTIARAYRKLAQQWHPDRFDTAEEKEKAEKKFMDIADAKEVLTDPEKRKMFDNGRDPLDAEENMQRQQRNPFQGFNPFGGHQQRQRGGGGGNFHFKFN